MTNGLKDRYRLRQSLDLDQALKDILLEDDVLKGEKKSV
jgi:hypothetical protein